MSDPELNAALRAVSEGRKPSRRLVRRFVTVGPTGYHLELDRVEGIEWVRYLVPEYPRVGTVVVEVFGGDVEEVAAAVERGTRRTSTSPVLIHRKARVWHRFKNWARWTAWRLLSAWRRGNVD